MRLILLLISLLVIVFAMDYYNKSLTSHINTDKSQQATNPQQLIKQTQEFSKQLQADMKAQQQKMRQIDKP